MYDRRMGTNRKGRGKELVRDPRTARRIIMIEGKKAKRDKYTTNNTRPHAPRTNLKLLSSFYQGTIPAVGSSEALKMNTVEAESKGGETRPR